AEPDSRLRGDYGGLALVFAEAVGRRDAWKQALEGWNVVESVQVREWMAEGEARGEERRGGRGRGVGKGGAVLRQLGIRLQPGRPAELGAQVRATTDLEQLNRWFDAAATTASLQEITDRIRAG